MPYALCNDANIYYEVHGRGAPLLFINGLKADHANWFKLKNLLIGRYQVILFDNRAVGRTQDEGKPLSVETMADDVAALMTHLQLSDVMVVGHSLGGAIAQMLAYKYPQKVKSLFLLNTFLKLNDKAKAGLHQVLQLHKQGQSAATITEAMLPWGFSKSFLTPAIKEAILELSGLNPYPQSEQDFQRQYQALIGFDSSAWVEKIQQPTVVVTSKEDMTATPQESAVLAAKMQRAKLIKLRGGHASPIEQTQALSTIIKFEIEKFNNSAASDRDCFLI